MCIPRNHPSHICCPSLLPMRRRLVSAVRAHTLYVSAAPSHRAPCRVHAPEEGGESAVHNTRPPPPNRPHLIIPMAVLPQRPGGMHNRRQLQAVVSDFNSRPRSHTHTLVAGTCVAHGTAEISEQLCKALKYLKYWYRTGTSTSLVIGTAVINTHDRFIF